MSDYRDQWLAERRRRVQSTDAAALCGLAPDGWHIATPLHVWCDKLGLLPAAAETPELKSGRLLEGVVAALYEEQTGRGLNDPQGRIFVARDHEHMGATIDRFTADGERVIELKTTRFLDRGPDGWGEPGTDQVPSHYLCQVQHQLAVTGHRVADVAVLVGGQDLLVYTVERSAEFVDRLVEIERAFWELVRTRTEPVPDWQHPATPALVDKIRKPDPAKVLDLSDPLSDEAGYLYSLARQYREYGEQEKVARESREQVRAGILARVGDAGRVLLPGGFEVVRKLVTQKRAAKPAHVTEYVTLTVKEPS